MNILITGIHGFVGSNLVATLKEQHTIYGLDIVSPQKDGVVKTFNWNELEQIPLVDMNLTSFRGKSKKKRKVYFEIFDSSCKSVIDEFINFVKKIKQNGSI